jgi:Cu+-exporting ATPase
MLATIGYEPYISLDDAGNHKPKTYNKQRIYKLGVAGFCFGNIMMMSFPEYLSHTGIEHRYVLLFRVLNLILALPVFFYSGSEFFSTAWSGIKQKILNIDAPIALAVCITFARSVYEISTNTGSGYLDSMSGIVFFMLAGRVLQERTYTSLSFHRDYKAYFPIAVSVLTQSGTISKSLHDLKEKDMVMLHNGEIVPADAMILKGQGHIDYSFVTGESEPITIKSGELVYAGGKQVGEQIVIQIIKPVAGSYLTSLWNHYAFTKNKIADNQSNSRVHLLSKYFTAILLSLAFCTALFWWVKDPSKIATSVTAMLIVACPCALLLSATFTNGNLLKLFSNNGLFLRDASVIEQLGNIDHIVFDKTGTLTQQGHSFHTNGHALTEEEKDWLYNALKSSRHPYSQALVGYLGKRTILEPTSWDETTGRGISAIFGNNTMLIGSADFLGLPSAIADKEKAALYVNINNQVTHFHFTPDFRKSTSETIAALREKYKLSLLTGDNDRQKTVLQTLFGKQSQLLFEQKPVDKLKYIESLQHLDEHVLMIGDGLNDAGALQQSNVGITLADDINNFTPSCDAILDAKKLHQMPQLMRLAKSAQMIINTCFSVSIIYNIIGLSIAMQGLMQPMIAAILMPVSTLSIVLLAGGLSRLVARLGGLSLSNNG